VTINVADGTGRRYIRIDRHQGASTLSVSSVDVAPAAITLSTLRASVLWEASEDDEFRLIVNQASSGSGTIVATQNQTNFMAVKLW
jgi:hypothetical protein